MPTNPTASPTAPTKSKCPPVRRVLTGMTVTTAMIATTLSAVESQNRKCQSRYCAIVAASGRPSAPPTPRVALTRATAPFSFFGWMTSRRMLTPSAMTPSPMPWNTRPTTMGMSVSESAATTQPTAMMMSRASMMRRLPYMSPSRPLIGVEIAAASSVAVSTHDESARLVLSSSGSSGMIGVTTVCMNAAMSPVAARVAIIALSLRTLVRRLRCRGVRDPSSAGGTPPTILSPQR